MIARCRYIVVFTSLLSISEAARLKKEKKTPQIRGCEGAVDCGDCLTRTPSVRGGTYCKWCPFENWEGERFGTKPKGVCQPAWANEEACTQWSKFGVTEFTQTEPSRAPEIEDALVFCPKERLAAMQLDDHRSLNVALEALSTEVKRLNRFHATNPVLFDAKFGDTELLVEAGKFSLKATLLAISIISTVVGNSISLGLNLITNTTEIATAGEQERSQDKLISLGEEAHSQYFGDVTFGLIWKAYQEILSLSSEEVREKIESVRKSVIAEHTDVADAYQEFDSHTAVKVGKAAGHVGLFVGGFFTFGATWIADAVWTGVDLAASASTKAARAKGLELKTEMLLALARLKDESVWDDANDACDITDRYIRRKPCSSKPRPGDGKSVKRVCTRISPWGHSKGKIPNGLFSPQGRCLPAESMGIFLSDGLPCLSHVSCQSGYCHFDKRMQYFFSPHPRHFGKRGGEQIPVTDQLHSMQVYEVLSPGEHEERSNFSSVHPLKDFVAEYNSYEGVKFATTGTCATACPKSAIGEGDCVGLTLNANKESIVAANYDFGIKIPNRITTGFSSWPLDVYQPWNADWLLYLEDLQRVLGLLESAERSREVLEKVKEAYPEFCKGDVECPDPEVWDIAVAKAVLTVLAPLSVAQMRQLCMQADPFCPRSDSSSKVDEWEEIWNRTRKFITDSFS